MKPNTKKYKISLHIYFWRSWIQEKTTDYTLLFGDNVSAAFIAIYIFCYIHNNDFSLREIIMEKFHVKQNLKTQTLICEL